MNLCKDKNKYAPFLYYEDMKLNGALWGKEWMP